MQTTLRLFSISIKSCNLHSYWDFHHWFWIYRYWNQIDSQCPNMISSGKVVLCLASKSLIFIVRVPTFSILHFNMNTFYVSSFWNLNKLEKFSWLPCDTKVHHDKIFIIFRIASPELHRNFILLNHQIHFWNPHFQARFSPKLWGCGCCVFCNNSIAGNC